MRGIVHAELYDSNNQLLAVRDAENFITIGGRNAFLNSFFRNVDFVDARDSGWALGVILRGNDVANPTWRPTIDDTTDTFHSPFYSKGIVGQLPVTFDNMAIGQFVPDAVSAPLLSADVIMPFDFVAPEDSHLTFVDQIAGILLLSSFNRAGTDVEYLGAVLFNNPITYQANTQLKVNYTIHL